jgi:PPOX class probable F420-dependent enzyme
VNFIIDPNTRFGARVAERLAQDEVAWLVTVNPSGTPVPSLVWFLFEPDPASLLIYSQPHRLKLRNIAHNSRVALHFDSNGHGGDILIITGSAAVSHDPAAELVPAYAAKYAAAIARNNWTPATFSADYSVPIRVVPVALRGR